MPMHEVFFYFSEIWTVAKNDEDTIDAFQRRLFKKLCIEHSVAKKNKYRKFIWYNRIIKME